MPATKRPATESGNEAVGRPSKFRRTQEPGGPVTWQSLPVDVIHHIVGKLAPGSFELHDVPGVPLVGGFQHAPSWEEYSACRKALAALCRASRALNGVALPVLYRNVVLLGLANLSSFYKALVRFPERGCFVRQLTFSLSKRPVTISEVPDIFGTSVAHFLAPRFKFEGVHETPYDWALDRIRSTVLASFHDDRGVHSEHDITCALILPILALTPNLSNLNIAGFRSWTTRRAEFHFLHRDMLLLFLVGTDHAANMGPLRQVLEDWFPLDMFGLDQGRFGTAPVFPPPSLKLINVLMEPADSPRNIIANRVRLFKPWACRQLRSITESAEQDLQIPRDQEGYLHPSWALRNVQDCQLPRFLSVRDYMAKISRLDEDLFPQEGDHGSPVDTSGITRYRNLDVALRKAQTLRQAVIIHSQHVSLDVYVFSRMLQDRRPLLTRVNKLTLYDADTWPSRYVFEWTENKTLQTIIREHFPVLKVLEMTFRLKKDARRSVLRDFDPGEFDSVEKLIVPTEALWGPIRTVMDTLVVKDEDMSAPIVPNIVLDIDGNPVLDTAGNQIPLPDLWERQSKAINRTPPNCTSLCIMDWFAEYEPIPITPDPLKLIVAREGEHVSRREREEMRTELQIAVLNNTLLNNDEAVVVLRGCTNLNRAVAHIHGLHQDETVCYYPSIKGDACWDPKLPCVAEEVDGFIDTFIHALTSGLMAMCAIRRPGDLTSFLPAIKQLRPKLKTISFVYTLHSNLPDRGDDWHAHFADLKWRMWYHGSGLENSESEYALLRKQIKEGSGIDFELWEGAEGVLPQEPVWPDKMKAKASALGVLLNDYNHLWEVRAAERRKREEVPDQIVKVTKGIANLDIVEEDAGEPMDID